MIVVKNNQCEQCIHKNICSYAETARQIIEKIYADYGLNSSEEAEKTDIFRVCVECTEFNERPSIRETLVKAFT